MKSFRKTILFLVFVSVMGVSFSISSVSSVSHAEVNVCNPAETWFDKLKNALKALDIRRTTSNMISSALLDVGFQAGTGTSYEQFMGCMNNAQTLLNTAGAGLILPDCGSRKTADDICQSLFNSFSTSSPQSTSLEFAQGQSAGSLLGLGNYMHNNLKEPIPVNLAYYWNRTIDKVPVFNKALAASNVSYNNQLFLAEIFDIWKAFRNVSYGVIAVVMIVIGFMIMTRKRISQQAVVNVQYALPKVVLSLILITFSYPIGATLAVLGQQLQLNMPHMLSSLASGWSALNAVSSLYNAIAIIMLAYAAVTFSTAGIGLALLILVAVIMLISFVMWLLLQVKIFLIYVKLVFSIITAPLEFAIGAIPGADDRIAGWFKRIFIYILSMIVMQATLSIVLAITMSMIISFQSQGPFQWIGGGLLVLLGAPFFAIFGLYYAMQMPAKVEEFVTGQKKR